MKTSKIAAIGAVSIFAVVTLLLAVPAMAATQNTTLLTNASSTSASSTAVIQVPPSLTVGQTITFTSTSGTWHQLLPATPTATGKTGPASGTMVLTVTGVYVNGYTLSLTSGAITLVTASTTGTTASTTYTIASGSAEMGPHQAHLVGQGTLATIVPLTTPTPGSFLFSAGAHANFQGKTYNTLHIDLKVNGVEYGITLLVTAAVSPAPVA
jgi:hypothetical protein